VDPEDNRITVFTEPNYNVGAASTFSVGTYDRPAMEQNHIPNDSITSIIVPCGLKVEIYEDEYFNGNSKELLGCRTYEFLLDKEYKQWENKITSFKVIEDRYKASAYWELFGSI
jgi:hypothetical protein